MKEYRGLEGRFLHGKTYILGEKCPSDMKKKNDQSIHSAH
jgi:hypothetical protein